MAWLKWEAVCRTKSEGGLGVKNMRWFNAALMGKWVWRLVNEQDSLWARIIRSRYGERWTGERGMIHGGVRGCGGGWWAKVLAAVDGKYGNWFFSRLERRIGDGSGTRFWEDRWGGDGWSLRDRFPRLFHLSTKRIGLVGEMGEWREGRWEWEVTWRRGLRPRVEAEAVELQRWLEGVTLKLHVSDYWRWGGSEKGVFTVREAYEVIAHAEGEENFGDEVKKRFQLLWRSEAPLKQKVTAWRLLWDRLPTRQNLSSRLQLTNDERACPICQDSMESAVHLFLRCRPVDALWGRIFKWVGVECAMPREIGDHFAQFSGMVRGKKMKEALGGLWVCMVWVVWSWRNKSIFENWQWDLRKMEEEIKCRFWTWRAANGKQNNQFTCLEWTRKTLCQIWNICI